MAGERSYRPDGSVDLIPSQAAADEVPQTPSRRRLTPTELHDQRVAWGNKWGKLVSEAVRKALEGTD